MKVNPQILSWARETAGMSVAEAARALGFKDTDARSAEQRLAALENGQDEPSRSVLQKMADKYRRTLLVFYLQNPPRKGDRGNDFRTLPGAEPPRYNPFLDALIRDVQKRQAMVRALQEEIEAPAVDFVGSASLDEPVGDLVNRIKERLRFSLEDFRAEAKVEDSFAYLRGVLEAAGVFVLLLGNLGSHHTDIPVEVFRGFAVADPRAPFIVVNNQDAKAAWSFTALHEMAHLWLGTTGVSGTSIDARIERYCNDVAGEILLPAAELRILAGLGTAQFSGAVDTISTFAKARNISRSMVAYKLLRTGIISESAWTQLVGYFRQQWIESRTKPKQPERSTGGPSYYVVKRHRLGEALLELMRGSLTEGMITPTKAGQVLGVKPRNVEPLLHGTPLEVGR